MRFTVSLAVISHNHLAIWIFANSPVSVEKYIYSFQSSSSDQLEVSYYIKVHIRITNQHNFYILLNGKIANDKNLLFYGCIGKRRCDQPFRICIHVYSIGWSLIKIFASKFALSILTNSVTQKLLAYAKADLSVGSRSTSKKHLFVDIRSFALEYIHCKD